MLVQQDVKDEFVNKLEESITQFYSSNPASSDDYGKIINETRFDTLTSYLANAKVIHGGKHDRKSLFIEPTIIDATPDFSNPLWRDEIFGPILPVAGYSNYAEARSWVERNPNPLAFYVFTSSRKTEEQWIEDVAFGGGCVNNTAWHFANHHIPFGGVGNSGIGSYHGKGTFETFTRAKPMMKTPTWLDPSFKYPPFKGKMKLFKWFIR